MTLPEPSFDADSYPTDDAIDAVAGFHGTLEQLVEYTTALYRNGLVKLEDAENRFGRPIKRVSYITCGWLGCESVIGAIRRGTMFNLMFWARSERGGLDVFEIGRDLWTTNVFWGDPTHRLGLGTNWDVPEAERTEQQAALHAAYPRWPGQDTHEAFTLGWNAGRDSIPA